MENNGLGLKKKKRTSAAVKNRYNSKAYDRINLTVKKGKKEEYKRYAEENGKSLNSLISEAIEKMIETGKSE